MPCTQDSKAPRKPFRAERIELVGVNRLVKTPPDRRASGEVEDLRGVSKIYMTRAGGGGLVWACGAQT